MKKPSLNTILIIVIIVIILVAAAVAITQNKKEVVAGDKTADAGFFKRAIESLTSTKDQSGEWKPKENTGERDLIAPQGNKTYTDELYGFSFEYPADMKVGAFTEGDYGQTVLVQNTKTKKYFQIAITPFDEPGPLTPERIKKDIPDIAVNNPQNVIITQAKIPALIFFSDDSGAGKTREVWFIARGQLFQVSTRADLDGFIGKTMESFKFK